MKILQLELENPDSVYTVKLNEEDTEDFIFMLQSASNGLFNSDEQHIAEQIDEWLFEHIPESWL